MGKDFLIWELYRSPKALAEEYGLPWNSLAHYIQRCKTVEEAVDRCKEAQEKKIMLWGKKYLTGQIRKGSWKVEENQMIKKQNALLQKVIATFGKVSGALSMWREWLNDIRRKQRSNSHDGSNDYTDRGTAEYHGRDASGDTGKGREADVLIECIH